MAAAFSPQINTSAQPLDISFDDALIRPPPLLQDEDEIWDGKALWEAAQRNSGESPLNFQLGFHSVPESRLGVKLEHQINPRQKIFGAIGYTPDIGNFPRYQFQTQAAWEYLLDPERNISLRMGVQQRRDTTPNATQAKDVNCDVQLIWKY
jgi:hypothetical protein